MKKIFIFSFLAGLLTLMINCKKDDNGPSDASQIPFLEVGNYWVYDYSSIFLVSEVRIEIMEKIDASTFEIKVTQTDGVGNTLTSLQEWKVEGGFLKTKNKGEELQSLIYKIDAKLGDSWSYQSSSQGTITHTVVATDTVINTMEGSYECVVYRRQATDIVNDSYLFWNKNAGEILEDAGAWASVELKENSVMQGAQGLFTSLLATIKDFDTEEIVPGVDVYILDNYQEFPSVENAIETKVSNLDGEVFFGDLDAQNYFIRVNDWSYDNSNLDSVYHATGILDADQMNLCTAYAETNKKKTEKIRESGASKERGISLFGLEGVNN